MIQPHLRTKEAQPFTFPFHLGGPPTPTRVNVSIDCISRRSLQDFGRDVKWERNGFSGNITDEILFDGRERAWMKSERATIEGGGGETALRVGCFTESNLIAATRGQGYRVVCQVQDGGAQEVFRHWK